MNTKKNLFITVVVSLSLACSTITSLVSPEETKEVKNINLELVGNIGGINNAIQVQENLAYIGEGLSMAIIDFTDPQKPVFVSKTDGSSDVVSDIGLSDCCAFVANARGGLFVYDITNPQETNLISNWGNGEDIQKISVHNDVALIEYNENKYKLLDISDPTKISLLAELPVQYLSSFAFIENYLYTSSTEDMLRIYDLSNLPEVKDLGTTKITGAVSFSRMILTENLALLVSEVNAPIEQKPEDLPGYHSSTIYLLDITNKENPLLVGSIDAVESDPNHDQWTTWTKNLVLQNGFVFAIADLAKSMYAIDLNNPQKPIVTDVLELGSYGQIVAGVQSDNKNVYVAWSGGEVTAIDISDPSDLTVSGVYYGASVVQDFTLNDNFAYMTSDNSGFRVVDLSDPSKPIIVGSILGAGESYGKITSKLDKYLYIENYFDGTIIVDISNPTQPIQAAFWNDIDPPLVIEENIGYVLYDDERIFQVINLNNPLERPVSNNISSLSIKTDDYPRNLQIKDEYVYIATNYDIYIAGYQYREPPSYMFRVGHLNYDASDEIKDFTIVRNYGYIFKKDNLNAGITKILDISSPRDPEIIQEYGFGRGIVSLDQFNNDFALYDTKLSYTISDANYFSSQYIDIYNISNPLKIRLSEHYILDYYHDVERLYVHNNYFYVSSIQAGLMIYKPQEYPISQPVTPSANNNETKESDDKFSSRILIIVLSFVISTFFFISFVRKAKRSRK
ncbi:MAG: hypothetical protein KJZ72_02615 [Anaerolineales bacterium]|nr:hypothetical protein [Anaerolineales bacterium]